METKELTIEIPKNHEIDWQESAKQEKIVFKKKEVSRPRSWEEYCYTHRGKIFFIDGFSIIHEATVNEDRPLNDKHDKNTIPSKELTEAFLAMMQLMSLRQAWIGDWEPDVKAHMYGIIYAEEGIRRQCIGVYAPLSFPTKEMTDDFMNCFKDLLEVAKPLI